MIKIISLLTMVTASSALSIELSTPNNQNLIIKWDDNNTLQSSTNLHNWTDHRLASSPVTNSISSDQEFYKTRLTDYTLFGNYHTNTDVALIDYEKNLIHTWNTDRLAGASVYLLPNGDLIRPGLLENTEFSGGGSGGRIQRINWDSEIIWEFDYSTPTNYQHHDIEIMPNGNLLLVAWDSISTNEAIDLGRNPAFLPTSGKIAVWPDTIVEIKPIGTNSAEIIWKWNALDHLVQDFDSEKPNYNTVSEHPELINLNYPPDRTRADWMHVNAVTYNPELDQIMLSVHSFSEIWIIDHSTTTEEAAGHTGGKCGKGGDLLYRWGNPAAYNMGTETNQLLGSQHNPTWIPEGYPGEGNILIFNNGTHRGHSSVDEILPPLTTNDTYALLSSGTYGPTNLTWTYEANPTNTLYATFVSSAQRLHNGNTILCDGPGRNFYEVDMDGNIIWNFAPPGVGFIFRAERIYFDPPK